MNRTTTYYTVVGQLLAKRRVALAQNQTDIASQVGTTQSMISRMENGSGAISVGQFAQWSAALGTTGSDILAMAERAVGVLSDQGVQVLYEGPQAARQTVNDRPDLGPLLRAAAVGALLDLASASIA